MFSYYYSSCAINLNTFNSLLFIVDSSKSDSLSIIFHVDGINKSYLINNYSFLFIDNNLELHSYKSILSSDSSSSTIFFNEKFNKGHYDLVVKDNDCNIYFYKAYISLTTTSLNFGIISNLSVLHKKWNNSELLEIKNISERTYSSEEYEISEEEDRLYLPNLNKEIVKKIYYLSVRFSGVGPEYWFQYHY